jgi:hypothetical protein
MWAKIVNDEIMQLHDEDPSGLWHPDAIAKNDIPGHWEQVPSHVHVGWRFRDNEWISGGQWHEEWVAANPPPPPGPPSAAINMKFTSMTSNEVVYSFISIAAGIFETIEWTIDGKVQKEVREDLDLPNPVTMTFERSNEDKTIDVSLKVSGPGGDAVADSTVTIPGTVVTP